MSDDEKLMELLKKRIEGRISRNYLPETIDDVSPDTINKMVLIFSIRYFVS